MSNITLCEKLFAQTKFTEKMGASGATISETRYIVKYGIHLSAAMTAAEIKADVLVPQIGDAYDEDNEAYLIERELTQPDTPTLWYFQASYSTLSGDRKAGDPSDPRNWSTKWTGSSVSVDSYPPCDLSVPVGAIVNSAGDHFLNGVSVPKTRGRFTATRYETTFDGSRFFTYGNRMNSVAYTIQGQSYPIKTVKCVDIQISPVDWRGGFVYQYTYVFEVDLEKNAAGAYIGWDAYLLDQGTREIVSGPKVIHITGDDGLPVTEPAPLNGAGVKLTAGQKQAGTYSYRQFQTHSTVDFNALAL